MKERIIELFSLLAKPYKDKEGGPKLEILQEWLNERNIQNEYIPGIGKIVNQQDNPRIILVSHIDLIKKFQKGFSEGKTHEIITSKKGKEIIQGALDNTITNAVALLSLELLLENNITDIEVVLTEGEEVGTIGMDNYLKTYKNKALNSFFINLDVTNDGWKKDVSIEYDKPSFYGVKHFLNILEEDNIHITSDRVGDDIDAVNDHDCFGLSFCLPTKDLIHSYDNKAYTNSLTGYLNALLKILSSFEYHENLKDTFSPYILDKAIELNDYEEFKKESREYEKNRYLTKTTNYDKEYKASLDINIDTVVDSLTSFIFNKLDNKVKSSELRLKNFLLDKVSSEDTFFLGEFATILKEEEYPFIKAKEILNILTDFGTIKKHKHTYNFRRP